MLFSILKALLSMFDVPSNILVAVCSFLSPFADFAFIKFIFISTCFLASSSYRFCACSYSICSVNSFSFFFFFLPVSLIFFRMFSRMFSNSFILSFVAEVQFRATVSSSFCSTIFSNTSKPCYFIR